MDRGDSENRPRVAIRRDDATLIGDDFVPGRPASVAITLEALAQMNIRNGVGAIAATALNLDRDPEPQGRSRIAMRCLGVAVIPARNVDVV